MHNACVLQCLPIFSLEKRNNGPSRSSMFVSFSEQVRLAKAADDLGEDFVSKFLPSLHRAAFNGFKETVEHLLNGGVDPNETTEKGRTALLYASFSKNNNKQEKKKMVKFLQSRGSFLMNLAVCICFHPTKKIGAKELKDKFGYMAGC